MDKLLEVRLLSQICILSLPVFIHKDISERYYQFIDFLLIISNQYMNAFPHLYGYWASFCKCLQIRLLSKRFKIFSSITLDCAQFCFIALIFLSLVTAEF